MGKNRSSPIWLTEREAFALLISSSISCGEVLEHFGFRGGGNNWQTVKRRCIEEGIDISHFDGKKRQQNALAIANQAIPLELVLVRNSTYTRNTLKARLLKSGVLQNICKLCGLDEVWNGKPIKMRLDHENGIFDDNRIDNLRMVCPNCDSQLETFCGKNKKRVPRNNCLGCGIVIARVVSKRCKRCAGKQKVIDGKTCKIEWPPNLELVAEIRETSNLAVAKKLGVTETAVRKRLIRLQKHGFLPDRLTVGQGTLTP